MKAREDEPYCGEQEEVAGQSYGYVCNAPVGHVGPHEAYGLSDTKILKTWPRSVKSEPRAARNALNALIKKIDAMLWCA